MFHDVSILAWGAPRRDRPRLGAEPGEPPLVENYAKLNVDFFVLFYNCNVKIFGACNTLLVSNNILQAPKFLKF